MLVSCIATPSLTAEGSRPAPDSQRCAWTSAPRWMPRRSSRPSALRNSHIASSAGQPPRPVRAARHTVRGCDGACACRPRPPPPGCRTAAGTPSCNCATPASPASRSPADRSIKVVGDTAEGIERVWHASLRAAAGRPGRRCGHWHLQDHRNMHTPAPAVLCLVTPMDMEPHFPAPAAPATRCCSHVVPAAFIRLAPLCGSQLRPRFFCWLSISV